ncbi:hypothetical protein OC834_007828, partial [Tilletia horrida]
MRLSTLFFGIAATGAAIGLTAALPQDVVVGVGAGAGAQDLEARGEIHDIMRIIRNEKCGKDFCSTFIHLPPPKTTTKTVTKTVTASKGTASTKVQTTVLTKTASPITRTSTAVVTVKVTPTVSATVVLPVPSTSTVTTITSVVTATEAVTQTVTSFTLPDRRRKASKGGDRIPSWLHGYCADSISKACSNIVTRSTCTKTKTVTTTRTLSKSVSTIQQTSVVTVVPTATAVVTVSTTATASPAITSTATVTTSSLVPVSATDVQTTVVTVTATAVVTLPSPNPVVTGRIKVTNTDDGTLIGYLGPERGGFGTTTFVGTAAEAIAVSIDTSKATGPVNIKIVSSSSHPYLGAVFGQNGNNPDLKANAGNRYLNMGSVEQVPASSQSSSNAGSSLNDNGLGGIYESQIWNYTPSSGALTVTWTNSDGSQVVNPSLVLVDLGISFFEWTLDTDTFENSYSGTQV